MALFDTPGKQENVPYQAVGVPDFQGIGSQRSARTSDIIFYIDTTLQSTRSGVVNGETVYNRLTGTSLSGAAIFFVLESAIYVGSVAPENLIWPLNPVSLVDQTNWTIFPSGFGLISFTEPDESFDQDQMQWNFPVRNDSAGTVDVIFRTKIRYMLNRG